MNYLNTNLEELAYKELQRIAKELSLPANGKKEVLINKIQTEIEKFKINEKKVEVEGIKQEQELEKQEEVKKEEVKREEKQEEQVDIQPQEQQEQQEEQQEDIQMISPEKYEQHEVEEEQDDYENVDPIDNRIDGKLFGIATPTGQKKLFNSPALSKSGQKLYEKYNVHWRYEDYENNQLPSDLLITPQKTTQTDDIENIENNNISLDYFDANVESTIDDVEDPEKRIGSNKLVGIPTPKGKSVLIKTPTDKKCDEYNVHWRYEDYENEIVPPSITSKPTTSFAAASTNTHINTKTKTPSQSKSTSQTATTPRSAKFKYVHAHP